MAGLAKFDIRDSSDTIPLHIAVTESAIQFCYLFVMDMVKPNRLIDRDLGKDRENRIKDAFCLNTEPIISDGSKQRNEDENNEKIDPFFHINHLLKQV